MQLGFYFNRFRCIGCYACEVACKDWHDIQDKEVKLLKLLTFESAKYPNVSVQFRIQTCYHCAEPACAKACPFDAISKRARDGLVVVDREKCAGIDVCGGSCLEACPYHAIQFSSEFDAKAQKCDYCLERWVQHNKPVCVEACPTKALDAGPLEELKAKYSDVKSRAKGSGKIISGPSIVFGYKA